MRELSWFGWGFADKTYSLARRPGAWPFLRSALDLRGDERFPVCAFESITLSLPRLRAAELAALSQIVGAGDVKQDTRARVLHAFGKSYRDLVRLRRGEVSHPPDAVIYPESEEQVARLLRFCLEQKYSIVPFGGGSSVVGGVEPLGSRVALTLDLARMNRVLSVDPISQTATIQAGMLGPDLERELNAAGWTLGHFPQSFEFSTLGGWIATRGAGLASTRYGKIEAMIQGLRMVTPSGTLEVRDVPASAAGPSLLQLVAGSEGTLGVITQATMRVRALPQAKDYQALLFRDFESGVQAIRALLQRDLLPATVRLSDEQETESFFALREQAHGWKAVYERAGVVGLGLLGHSFTNGALLILGFEGEGAAVRSEGALGREICRAHGAIGLGHGIAATWLADRYETPYLRDVLMDRGILADTLETATPWENLTRLHGKLAQSIHQAAEATGARAWVMTHVSHCYRDGASLYVTFLARMVPGHEIEQWETIKRAASECIVGNGGTISHHHGVGYEHAPWLGEEIGSRGVAALKALKAELDPQDIMNPGKLLSKEIR